MPTSHGPAFLGARREMGMEGVGSKPRKASDILLDVGMCLILQAERSLCILSEGQPQSGLQSRKPSRNTVEEGLTRTD